jgi:hypothetical protein
MLVLRAVVRQFRGPVAARADDGQSGRAGVTNPAR